MTNKNILKKLEEDLKYLKSEISLFFVEQKIEARYSTKEKTIEIKHDRDLKKEDYIKQENDSIGKIKQKEIINILLVHTPLVNLDVIYVSCMDIDEQILKVIRNNDLLK